MGREANHPSRDNTEVLGHALFKLDLEKVFGTHNTLGLLESGTSIFFECLSRCTEGDSFLGKASR